MIPVHVLLLAYQSGLFPMAVEGRIRWFSPDPRGVIPLDDFHVPRRLARELKAGWFAVRINTAFRDVIEGCASRGDQDTDWIDADILESYVALHHAGYAHSVEVWRDDRLAGGLYGVSLGGAFFGESMFHREPNASKAALCALVERLRARGYRLLDTQWSSPFLAQFGAIEIPRDEYLRRLADALRVRTTFGAVT